MATLSDSDRSAVIGLLSERAKLIGLGGRRAGSEEWEPFVADLVAVLEGAGWATEEQESA